MNTPDGLTLRRIILEMGPESEEPAFLYVRHGNQEAPIADNLDLIRLAEMHLLWCIKGESAFCPHQRIDCLNGVTVCGFCDLPENPRDRDRDPEGDETRSGSVERSEIEPGREADRP